MGVLVVGTGALACLFSARLSASGVDVTMLGSWPEGIEALRQHGVRLKEMDGSSQDFAVKVLAHSGAEKFTQALVLVKSWQTEKAAAQLSELLDENAIALTLQNGLGNAEILDRYLGMEHVGLGVTHLGARLLSPGHVQHTGQGKVFLGNNPRLKELAILLSQAGFQIEIVQDPTSLLWGKLVVNAAINPLTAILQVTNGELLKRPSAYRLMKDTAKEAVAVAEKLHISLPYPDAVAMVEEVARNTSGNQSSMLQDVMRGGETEIDAINGAIVRAGEAAGVDVPINRVLWQLVSSLHNH